MKKITAALLILLSFNINHANTTIKEATLQSEITESLYSDPVEQELIKGIVDENLEYPHYAVGTGFLSGKVLEKNAEKALFWLAQSSEVEKYNRADFLIGEIYTKGLIDRRYYNPEKGIFFYERAANRGNEEAKLKLAVNYLYNDSFLDQEKGLYWLNQSLLDNNVTAAQLYSALTLTDEDAKTVLKQLDLVLMRSESGDHLSSFYLGLIYLKNNIVKRDLNQAQVYFLRAIAQGNIIAEEILLQIDKIKRTEMEKKK